MNPRIETVYLGELLNECENAIAAVRRMNAILAKSDEPAREFFREATDFLQHAACASRLLWPAPWGNAAQRARAEDRGKHLRDSLGVDSAHLLSNRDLRNHLEHYDERIDEWAATSHTRGTADGNIGPRSMFHNLPDSDVMRHFDQDTKTFTFRGQAFNVQEIVNAVADVRRRAAERLTALDR